MDLRVPSAQDGTSCQAPARCSPVCTSSLSQCTGLVVVSRGEVVLPGQGRHEATGQSPPALPPRVLLTLSPELTHSSGDRNLKPQTPGKKAGYGTRQRLSSSDRSMLPFAHRRLHKRACTATARAGRFLGCRLATNPRVESPSAGNLQTHLLLWVCLHQDSWACLLVAKMLPQAFILLSLLRSSKAGQRTHFGWGKVGQFCPQKAVQRAWPRLARCQHPGLGMRRCCTTLTRPSCSPGCGSDQAVGLEHAPLLNPHSLGF